MMEFPTTDVDEMIRIMNTYTAQIGVVTLPSGAMSGSAKYGKQTKSVNSLRYSEDAVLRCVYNMIMDDMHHECFIVEKFKLTPVNL